MVLGIVGLVLGLVPILFFVALPCGVLAIVFGILGRRREEARGMALAGLICGGLAVMAGIAGVAIVNDAFEDLDEDIDEIEEGLPEDATSAEVRVEAGPDVCWSGSIGDSTQEGCGAAQFDVTDEGGGVGFYTATISKQEGAGELTLVLVLDGEEVDRSTTAAEFGFVTVTS